MPSYHFSYPRPQSHFFNITYSQNVSGKDQVVLNVPAWRPGRYQMADFAQNIRDWKPYDENNNPLKFRKTGRNTWLVFTGGATELNVDYEYYAYKLDAGNSYLDDHLIYINPISCCIYDPTTINHSIELHLTLPNKFECATTLPSSGPDVYTAEDFHHLVDAPLIASADLQYNKYEEQGYTFHIWFQGITVKPEWKKLIKDFKHFTREQLNTFKDFPAKEYHFFILSPAHPLYHGVEHIDSTVITLGPGYTLMKGENYNRLLGISSHELYHAWNIKTIRPAEMMPYDYNNYSYSTLGYVAEGVTTYFGDHYLLRSDVWDFQEYSKKLGLVMTRHFNNYGRFHRSVADSSFDTWLDGYQQGIPDRKVSIYIKGCLCALMLDLMIRKDTNNKHSLDDVMVALYKRFAKKQKGFTPENYQKIIEEVAGKSYKAYFDQFIYGTVPLEDPLNKALNFIGCKMIKKERSLFHENKLGFTVNKEKAALIAPDSPAANAGLTQGDELISVNGIRLNDDPENLSNLLEHIAETEKNPVNLQISRGNLLRILKLKPENKGFFADYIPEKKSAATDEQKAAFLSWSGSAY